MEELKFPIGHYIVPDKISPDLRSTWIQEIANFPLAFRKMAESLSPKQLQLSYRPEGWTAEQVIHHVPDSHMNAYLRYKWALTEDHPTIKAYNEVSFAERADYYDKDIESSLLFLEAIHKRWVRTLISMEENEWKRGYDHPEDGKTYVLDSLLGNYVWHGKHHLGHLEMIKNLT